MSGKRTAARRARQTEGVAAAPAPRPPAAASLRSLIARPASLVLLLTLATAAVYAPVRTYPLLNYDDQEYVTENAYVNAGLTWEGFVWAWTGVHQATWHPLTTLTHMVDCELFGLNGGPHHVVNLVLHVLNTLLLFGVLTRMTSHPLRSAWVAGLFALHPLHVESVAWVSERKDVLSTFFGFVTLWVYVSYVRRPSMRLYGAMLAAYIAALLSKPMVVTLPFVFLLLDVWPLRRVAWGSETVPRDAGGGSERDRRNPRERAAAGARTPGRSADEAPAAALPLRAAAPRLLLEKLPLLALAAIVSAITYFAQVHAGAVASLETVPFVYRIGNALVSYAAYLRQMVWPAGLAVFYPLAPLSADRVMGAAAALALITAGVLRWARHAPYLLVGWLWYLGMLVPVIGLVRQGDQAMADRFTYVPLVGVFIMVAWGVPDLLRRWRHVGRACAVAAVATLVACSVLTVRQVRYWQDTLTLFERALAVTRDNWVAHFIIGAALQDQNRLDEAFPHLAESLRLHPYYDKTNYDIGLIFAARGDLAAAKRHYQRAVESNPRYAKALVGLGMVASAEQDHDAALRYYREAVHADPKLPAAHNHLAIALEDRGELDAAIVHYGEGVRLEPRRAESRCNLAAALTSAGRLPEAIEEFRVALTLAPRLSEARVGLASAYLRAAQPREAIAELDAALRERPEWTAVELMLAWVLATVDDAHLRDGARAVRLAEAAAARSAPDDPDALNTLAAAYAEAGRFDDAVATASRALAAARAGGRTALAGALDGRLAHYRAGEAVRERPGVQ